MYLGRHGGGWQVFSRPKLHEGVLKDQVKGKFPDPEHKENFVQCIRSRKLPNADVEEGHRSALWIHYANISYRLGGQKLVDRSQDRADRRQPRGHEAVPDVETYRKPWTIG